MRIVSVEPLDKRRSRVLGDGGLAFVLYSGEIRHYQIEEGKELAEETYQEILESVLCKRARERLLYLLKLSDKTESQLRKKLDEGLYPRKAVEAAIAFGKRYGYIDDVRYAENYVALKGGRKSRRQIAYELRQKGIGEEIVRECLEENPVDEDSQIKKWLEKRGFDPETADEKEWGKTVAFLSRKGFSYTAILDIMHKKY